MSRIVWCAKLALIVVVGVAVAPAVFQALVNGSGHFFWPATAMSGMMARLFGITLILSFISLVVFVCDRSQERSAVWRTGAWLNLTFYFGLVPFSLAVILHHI